MMESSLIIFELGCWFGEEVGIAIFCDDFWDVESSKVKNLFRGNWGIS